MIVNVDDGLGDSTRGCAEPVDRVGPGGVGNVAGTCPDPISVCV